MVTIGDVFGVVAFLLGLGITAWSLLMAYCLLFPGRVMRARETIAQGPKASFAVGVLGLLFGLAGVALLSAPSAPLKLVGWVMALSILGFAALGASGMGHLAADRLKAMAPEMSGYSAYARGTGYLVAAAMFPLLGWFAFGPLMFITSIGGGIRAVMVPVTNPALTGAD